MKLPGINIQYPISQAIVSRSKVVETRFYPLPDTYLNKPLFLIETPGPSKGFKARITAVIIFTSCFQYENAAQFEQDFARHRVAKDSPWGWQRGKKKWGWQVKVVEVIDPPVEVIQRRGIRFTRELEVKSQNSQMRRQF